MADDVTRMDITKFRELGYLQEANRRYFHPLGLALEVKVDEDGTETLGGIQDFRDDPEGLIFTDNPDDAAAMSERAARIDREWKDRQSTRQHAFGWMVQPLPRPDHAPQMITITATVDGSGKWAVYDDLHLASRGRGYFGAATANTLMDAVRAWADRVEATANAEVGLVADRRREQAAERVKMETRRLNVAPELTRDSYMYERSHLKQVLTEGLATPDEMIAAAVTIADHHNLDPAYTCHAIGRHLAGTPIAADDPAAVLGLPHVTPQTEGMDEWKIWSDAAARRVLEIADDIRTIRSAPVSPAN